MSRVSAGAPPCRLRPIAPADLPAVLAVQRAAYGDAYQESAVVLGAKLARAPGGCWLAEGRDGVLGYVFAHPWAAEPPPLHVALADARAYWLRKGFASARPAGGAALPAGYGTGADFMTLDLARGSGPSAG